MKNAEIIKKLQSAKKLYEMENEFNDGIHSPKADELIDEVISFLQKQEDVKEVATTSKVTGGVSEEAFLQNAKEFLGDSYKKSDFEKKTGVSMDFVIKQSQEFVNSPPVSREDIEYKKRRW